MVKILENTKFKGLCLTSVFLCGAIGATAVAQSSSAAATSAGSAATATDTARSGSMNPDDTTTYATGKPLQQESREGFWGHVNPFARKKWVRREVDPIRERTNELDQLQAKNANDIRDVDSRATAGIGKAMAAANAADAHAADASSKATAAQTTATTASSRTDSLNGTVSNLDQYSQVLATSVKFAPGHTTLGPQGKSTLDDMATKLAGEKGYIIEVQGYSKAGVQSSQAMADSVVRYLVTEHEVPLYRIYRTGLGKSASTDSETAIVNGVRVTLLHNSLASMAGNSAPGSTSVPQPSAQVQPGVNQ